MSQQLIKKIKTKKLNVAVVGLGYVGLPLAVSFANKGLSVYGLDTDLDRVESLNRGKSYISDIPTKDVRDVIKRKKFICSNDFSQLKDADAILICVPTPLKRKYTPNITYIVKAMKTVSQNLKKGALVILESTTYPGTTEELILPMLEEGGRKVGKDFFLSFSPERIDPGNKQFDVTRIPKVVGGVTKKCGLLTKALYELIIKEIHLVSTARAAEMTKLLENTFRIINIGWINEVAMMSDKMDIDVWEVIEAAKTKPFGFMPFYPGLGVGGHCIPDDPLYLYWKAKHHGFSSKFIKLSADINSQMPLYIKEQLKDAFKKRKISYSKARILIIGVTYKKDVKDLRKSPSLKLYEYLLKGSRCVDYHDPYIPYLDIGNIKTDSIFLSPKNIKSYDCVIIAVDHSKINYEQLYKHSKLIYDIKNIFSNKPGTKVLKI